MVGARRRAPRVVDLELDRVAGLELAAVDLAEMHEEVAELLLGVGNAEQAALPLIRPWSPTWPPDSP